MSRGDAQFVGPEDASQGVVSVPDDVPAIGGFHPPSAPLPPITNSAFGSRPLPPVELENPAAKVHYGKLLRRYLNDEITLEEFDDRLSPEVAAAAPKEDYDPQPRRPDPGKEYETPISWPVVRDLTLFFAGLLVLASQFLMAQERPGLVMLGVVLMGLPAFTEKART